MCIWTVIKHLMYGYSPFDTDECESESRTRGAEILYEIHQHTGSMARHPNLPDSLLGLDKLR